MTDCTCSACEAFGQWEALTAFPKRVAAWRLMSPELGALGGQGLGEAGPGWPGHAPPSPFEEWGFGFCPFIQVPRISQKWLPRPHA